ncbi:MAG TPA: YidC/Oxa1 family membrane protein insertase [Gemmatimonadaceae bacterium]|nr:YidC/Oxa1 family membrane protein insertase [Gemmatimonadaceae bacterium]
MWDSVVTVVRVAMFTVAHLCGGSLGAGILLVSAAVRVALLPLTLRLAREVRAKQIKLAALEPELAAIRNRYEKDPARMMAETSALHRAHGIQLVTPRSALSLLVQAPLLGAMYTAVRRGLGAGVRFFWIGDLARPDLLLTGLVTSLSIAIVATTPGVPGRPTPSVVWILSGGLTLMFLWSASSAFAISMGAGSLVSLVQNWIVSRDPVSGPTKVNSVPVATTR